VSDHRGIKPTAVAIVVPVHFLGWKGVSELNQSAVLTDQEAHFAGGDFLFAGGGEHPGEGQITEIEDFNEVRRSTDPAVLQLRHSFGSLSDTRFTNNPTKMVSVHHFNN
jgi:hypothetical protein